MRGLGGINANIFLPVMETFIDWSLLVVRLFPFFCSMVQMYSPLSTDLTGLTSIFPFGSCLNLFVSIAFPSVLVHVNRGGGAPSALHLRMPDVPTISV